MIPIQWLRPTMFWLALFATILMIPHAVQGQDTGDTALTVSPAFAWISESSPYGGIRLTNPGTRSVEVLFDLAYGVIEANQDGGGNIIRMDSSRVEGNLTEHLTIFPPRMVIPPGETQLMRYAVDLTTLPDGGYTAILLCSIAPRAPVNPEQIPDPASTIQIHFTMSVPLILHKGIGAPQISAQILELDASVIKLLLTNETRTPWGGTVRLTSPDGAIEYSHGGISVLMTNREVTLPLSTPLQGPVRVEFDQEVSWIPAPVRARLTSPPPILIER